MTTANEYTRDARHWLIFGRDVGDEKIVVGCYCGFQSDLDECCGYGDDVVRHLIEAGLARACASKWVQGLITERDGARAALVRVEALLEMEQSYSHLLAFGRGAVTKRQVRDAIRGAA